MSKESREGLLILALLLAVIFLMVGVWTGPWSFATRAIATAGFFFLCAAPLFAIGRRP